MFLDYFSQLKNRYALTLSRIDLGNILGDFFTNSSVVTPHTLESSDRSSNKKEANAHVRPTLASHITLS
jgi:hypothetical protein